MDFLLPKYQFEVIINGSTCAVFSQVSGDDQDDSSIEYRNGSNHVVKARLLKYERITLKNGSSSNREFIDWIAGSNTNTIVRKNISIVLLDDASNTAAAVWEVTAAWPVKYAAVNLIANEREVDFDSIELVHEGLYRV